MDLKELAALGEKLGHSGKDLQYFITEQQSIAHEQRMQHKELIEGELRLRQLHQERVESGTEKEIVEMQLNIEKMKKERIEKADKGD